MILSILATVAVLAAIVVMLSALVFAETVLVYIALGLGATSVILLIGALVQQRSGTTGPEPELSGTDGLGKSSVPVTQTGSLVRGATVVGSMPDTAEPEDSRRVPAPASEPVRDASASGTDTVEVEEETEYGEPEYEVPRWQTPTQGDRPDPGGVHVPAHEGTPEEETTPAPAAPAGASAFDDEEVPFSSSVRAAEAGREENGHLLRNRDLADTEPVPEPDEGQTSAPEQVEPEEAPATAPTPDNDDGGPVGEDGTDDPRAEVLEDEEPAEEALEPAADLAEAAPELSDASDEGSEDGNASTEDEVPAEGVRSFDEDAESATDDGADTEDPGAEAELGVPVEEEAAEGPAPVDDTGGADEDEGVLEARAESADTDIDDEIDDGTGAGVAEAELGAPVEEEAAEDPAPVDGTDSADTVEETDGDPESEEEQDVPGDGTVSTDAEVSSEREPAGDGAPASATEAEGPDAEESGDPGREPEDEPSAEEAAGDGTDDERATDDAENVPDDNAGEHAVAYAIIVDSDRDPADQETETVGAEDSGSSR